MRWNTIFLFGILVTFNSCQEQRVKTINSECNIDVEQTFVVDSVIEKFRLELKNENIRENFSTLIANAIKILEDHKVNENAAFPYQKIDSAFYYDYELINDSDPNYKLSKRKPKSITRLCSKKIKALCHLFHNPNYFTYAECGTAIPESEIKLFNSGKIIGRIEFACDHRQTLCEPNNGLNKFGGLNETGYSILNKIAPWK